MIEDALKEAGFTNAQAKTYLSLIRLGGATIGSIIRDSGLHNSVVYNSLQGLIEKGFVSYSKTGKIKFFSAADPAVILEEFKSREEKLKSAVEELSKKRNESGKKHNVEIYEGLNGLKSAFNSILSQSSKGDYIVFGLSDSDTGLGDKFLKGWDEKRIKKRIKKRVILVRRSSGWKDYYRNRPYTDTRVIDTDPASGFNMTVNVHGKRTMLILWSKYPISIIFDSADISENFRNYFELLWKKSRKA